MTLNRNKIAGLATIPLFIFSTVLLTVLNYPLVFEPPFVLGILNTIFLGIIPLFIAWIAYLTYSEGRSSPIPLFGSGFLMFGLGSIAAGWLNLLPDGSGISSTVHFTSVFVGSILILTAIIMRFHGYFPARRKKFSAFTPLALYAGVAAFVALFTLGAVTGIVPPFFTPGGPFALLRGVVLIDGIELFALSAILVYIIYQKRNGSFFFWFSMAFALVSIGLLNLSLRGDVGSLVGWNGRIAEYTGACFALFGMVSAQKMAFLEGISLPNRIHRFFSGEGITHAILSASTESIWLFGTDGMILTGNPTALARIGREENQVIGHPFTEFVDTETGQERMERLAEVIRMRQAVRFEDEDNGTVFDNTFYPVFDPAGEVTGIASFSRDITDSKWAEELLWESEKKYFTLFELAPFAVALALSPEQTFVEINEAFRKMFGYSREEVVGKSHAELGMSEPDFSENLTRAMAGRRYVRDFPCTGHSKSGETRDLSLNMDKVILGGKEYYLATLRDVTEEKRAEEALLRHDQILISINAVLGAALTTKTEADLAAACLNTAKILTGSPIGFVGVRSKDGLRVIAIDPPSWGSCMVPRAGGGSSVLVSTIPAHGAVGQVLETGRGVMVNTPVLSPGRPGTPAGHPAIESFLGVPLSYEGEVTGIIAVGNKQGGYSGEDMETLEAMSPAIGEAFSRKRMEEVLRESEERFRSAQEAAKTATWERDLETGATVWSTNVWQLCGIDPDIQPSYEAWMASIVPEDRDIVRKIMGAAESAGEEVLMEWRVRQPGGNIRWLMSRGQPVRNGQGMPSKYRGIVIDITDRKRAEVELQRKNEELNTALAEKEILLSEIHHRVKNNLAAFVSLLSLQGATEETPAGKMLKKDLQNRARSMALIHETLYKTRRFSEVDADVYLNTLVNQIAASFPVSQPVTTTVNVDHVMIDLARATPAGLIVNELVTNAFKYAFPASFDTRAVRGELPVIAVSLKQEGGFYVLSVRDNGIGLPPGTDPAKIKTLGLKLVNFLARHQLQAEMEIHTENGTEFVFRFREQK